MCVTNQLAIRMLNPPHTNRIVQDEERLLIHEHDFITVTTKEANNSFLVHCITCGVDYCSLCGKVLHKN